MKSLTVIGVILIIFGIAAFGYQRFTYTEQEEILKLGDVQVVQDTEKTVSFPPIVGGAAIAVGLILVVIARIKK